jgi:hypothetical protein
MIAGISDSVVKQFKNKIDQLKYPREWIEYMFQTVKRFYYIQFALYLAYLYALNLLVMEGLSQEQRAWTWQFYCSLCCVTF